MNFYDIFVRYPVNASAAKMLATSAASGEDEIGIGELIYLIERLNRKRSLLERVLLLDTRAKKKNLNLSINKGMRATRSKVNPRSVDEWHRSGKAIERLTIEITRRKAEYKKSQRLRYPKWSSDQMAHYKATGEKPLAVEV